MTEEKDQKTETYEFGDCVVDADRRELSVAGETVDMQPKAFELLLFLIRNRHRAVDKDELQDELWPRTIVTETALTRCVMKARRAVGDDADRQHAIKTVHGHGYRFVADIDEALEPAPTEPLPEPARPATTFNWRRLYMPGAIGMLAAFAIGVYMMLAPPALGGPIRLAVLPVENATGDEGMEWVSTGLMALMDRMLQDDGIDTVSSGQVTGLAGDSPVSQLVATGSEFRDRIAKSAAATHVLGARIEDNNGLYRITYTLAGAGDRPTRRTMVGKEPTQLVKDLVRTVSALIVKTPTPDDDEQSISNDEFLNQAFARGMVLYKEGRYSDAKELFEVVIEQEPHLFWPRYERALTLRNMREYDAAERELFALRKEFPVEGNEKAHASIENALGVMYMYRQRHDEARAAYERAVELSTGADEKFRLAVTYQNMGLMERGLGAYEKALVHMTASEETYRTMDIEMLPGTLHNNLSGVLIQMGQFEEAMARSEQAVEAFRFTGERRNESAALNRLADIHARLRNYDEAIAKAEASMAIRQELGDTYGVGSSLVTLADISSIRGNFTKALQYAQQAYDIGTDIDDHRIVVSALVRVARNESRLGNHATAAARWDTLESIARLANDGHNVWRSQLGKAAAFIKRARYDEALAIAETLLQDARDQDRRREETAALRIFAGVYAAQGRHEEAIDVLEETYAIAEEIEDTVVKASVHLRLAESWLALGDAEAAAPHVEAGTLARPEDYDSLKIQAQYASLNGQPAEAARLMGDARTNAGEGWSDEDADLLAAYREAASSND